MNLENIKPGPAMKPWCVRALLADDKTQTRRALGGARTRTARATARGQWAGTGATFTAVWQEVVMGTKIEWCNAFDGYKGEVWNPVVGCTPISEGCENCYAERQAPRVYHNADRPFEPRSYGERLR